MARGRKITHNLKALMHHTRSLTKVILERGKRPFILYLCIKRLFFIGQSTGNLTRGLVLPVYPAELLRVLGSQLTHCEGHLNESVDYNKLPKNSRDLEKMTGQIKLLAY